MFEPRKRNRIPYFDYSLPNYYYLTLCTHDRKCYFGKPDQLSEAGIIVRSHIERLDTCYPQIRVDKYVIMPNHIHMILVLEGNDVPGIPHIISQFKGAVSKEIRKKHPRLQLWQRSYYDHVIRDQRSYEQIWLYIEGNPQCLEKDDHFVENCPF